VQLNLVVFKPNGARREAQLQPGTYLVGRDENATLRIPMKSVSRSHCELTVEDDRVSVKDLGSTNGTVVNGQRIDQTALRPGDVLTLGGVQIVFQINGKPEQIDRPDPDINLDLDLDDTPPGALSTPKKKPILSEDSADDSSIMGKSDFTRGTGDPGDSDDSSVFDFDFDFPDDDDDKPGP